jgi:hypothetical protein
MDEDEILPCVDCANCLCDPDCGEPCTSSECHPYQNCEPRA